MGLALLNSPDGKKLLLNFKTNLIETLLECSPNWKVIMLLTTANWQNENQNLMFLIKNTCHGTASSWFDNGQTLDIVYSMRITGTR